MKGKNLKHELYDKMPPDSQLFMSEKSAYTNPDLFLRWLKTHFVPRKPEGTTLLLLDGHTSHSSSVEMLQYAKEYNIILLCFPSHCTHYLQPLDRSVFKSVKSAFYKSCQLWLKQHAGRRITRYQFGELLSDCWGKSATPENATAGFRPTRSYPFNPDIILDYSFSIADLLDLDATEMSRSHHEERQNRDTTPSPMPQVEGGVSLLLPEEPNEIEKEIPSKLLQELSPVSKLRIESTKKIKIHRKYFNICELFRIKEKYAEKKQTSEKNDNLKNIPSTCSGKRANFGNKRAKNRTKISKKTKRDESSSDSQVSSYDSDSPRDEDDDICFACGEFGKDNELWFRF
ncbi:unnamed protein product [Acanthoscelides obtectus]|uniref:DDE-1 domain-containing protein n=1 Tax=Acanthoscelides obtectus TaxID=200917 RepID=A0A9P0JZB1_ACAOB|nr:unnamed protein product [Acanthoscelides obtectus]CAK1621874.1 hypothetical protein AOBTE_LOCUS1191 [Acanthoscelides obtectus]